MLRRVQTDGWSVTQAAKTFGLSRLSFYHARSAFEREGLSGLVAKKRGPKDAHKLSRAVMAFVEQLIENQPELNARVIAQHIEQRFGRSVHPRSVERALKRQEKKRSKRP
jgi:transposase